jgi:hypothetical protein
LSRSDSRTSDGTATQATEHPSTCCASGATEETFKPVLELEVYEHERTVTLHAEKTLAAA